MASDPVVDLELQNATAIGRANSRRLETTEVDKEPCKVCHGTGVVPGTESEDLYGEPCPEGCPLDRNYFVRREDLPRMEG